MITLLAIRSVWPQPGFAAVECPSLLALRSFNALKLEKTRRDDQAGASGEQRHHLEAEQAPDAGQAHQSREQAHEQTHDACHSADCTKPSIHPLLRTLLGCHEGKDITAISCDHSI